MTKVPRAVTQKVKSGADYTDVVAAPDIEIAELVEGDLYLSPRPTLRHSRVLSTIGADVHEAFDRGRRGPGGWLILDEPEVHILGDVLAPDVAGWRRENLPAPLKARRSRSQATISSSRVLESSSASKERPPPTEP